MLKEEREWVLEIARSIAKEEISKALAVKEVPAVKVAAKAEVKEEPPAVDPETKKAIVDWGEGAKKKK